VCKSKATTTKNPSACYENSQCWTDCTNDTATQGCGVVGVLAIIIAMILLLLLMFWRPSRIFLAIVIFFTITAVAFTFGSFVAWTQLNQDFEGKSNIDHVVKGSSFILMVLGFIFFVLSLVFEIVLLFKMRLVAVAAPGKVNVPGVTSGTVDA